MCITHVRVQVPPRAPTSEQSSLCSDVFLYNENHATIAWFSLYKKINRDSDTHCINITVYSWCGRRDLNPHGLPQEPETCASANFATSAYEDSQKTVFLSSPEEASRRKTFPPADMLFTGSPLCISRAALFSNPQAHHLLYSTISSKSSVLSS